MYNAFISPAGMAELRAHKYTGSVYTRLDLALNPFWEAVAALMPAWVAPNLITLVAFTVLALGCLACLAAPRALLHRRPSPVLLLCAAAGFVYQTLDAVDGKQARRLGRSSPLGQLFDHGCDCVGVTFWTYMVLSALGAREDPLAVCLTVLASVCFFYPAQFAEYFTRVLVTSSHGFGVTETQLLLIGAMLLAAVIGPGVFGRQLPGAGVSLARVLCLAALLCACGLSVTILRGAYLRAPPGAFLPMLLPITAHLALTLALFASPARRSPTALYFLCMFAFNSLAVKMILSSITRMPYALLHVELLPLAGLLAAPAALPALLLEPSFLPAMYAQQAAVVELLTRHETLRELLDIAYEPELLPDRSFAQRCQLAFAAAQTLASLPPAAAEALAGSRELLKRLFSVVACDEVAAATAQGYFLAIVRQLLAEGGPAVDPFLVALTRHKEVLVLPLAEHLGRAAAEAVKLILLCPRPELARLQLGLFEYLLFLYLNEKYAAQPRAAQHLANLCGVFAELAERKAPFAFKQKYVPNLFLPVFVRQKALGEHVFALKLAVLAFVAETGQLREAPQPLALLENWERYAQSPRAPALLAQALRVLAAVVALPGFAPEPALLERLFQLQQRFPRRDVVLARLFAVLRALAPAAGAAPPLAEVCERHLQRLREESTGPGGQARAMNPVPLGLVLGVLEPLLAAGTAAGLADWADELHKAHARLYRDDLLSSEVNVSEVRLTVRPDFALLGDGLDEPGSPEALGLLERSQESGDTLQSAEAEALVVSDLPELSPTALLVDSGVEAAPASPR